MMKFRLESWAAMAPGLETREDWQQWLQNPTAIDQELGKISVPGIPAMLRRRLNTLGKCAMAASMPLVEEIEAIPGIFASRHGDTELSFSLLQGIGQKEPMSPTSFSLAVHNAVAGLFSIARKDTSAVTAIAAMDGLVLQSFFEAFGQLQETDRVFCVIYDIPLPEFYRQHSSDDEIGFPYAIAMILSRVDGESFEIEPGKPEATPDSGPEASEPMQLLALLAGSKSETWLQQSGNSWRMARVNG